MKQEALLPNYFLSGLLVGFLACILAGWIASKNSRLENFDRFYAAIDPSTQYFPTANQLLATAKHDVAKDQILVLIGGSSILRGYGQNSDKLWSHHLQRLLGNRYKVLNYANDGANFQAFGGVMFKVLKNFFPKIIFISTCFPGVPGVPVDGEDLYAYLFWDAYYKNMMSLNNSELASVKSLRRQELKTQDGIEKHIRGILDSKFYFTDLWNWLGYYHFFTIWTFQPTNFYDARKNCKEVPLDYTVVTKQVLADPQKIKEASEIEEKFVAVLTDIKQKQPHLAQDFYIDFQKTFDTLFPFNSRSNIISLLIHYNPHLISSFPSKMLLAYKAMFNDVTNILKDLGYQPLAVGSNFTQEDFVDEKHFKSTGGQKLAEILVEEIKKMAKQNGFDH